MADHTPPLESGQLLSPELPVLASPPPPAMVNGEGPQQVCHAHLLIHWFLLTVFGWLFSWEPNSRHIYTVNSFIEVVFDCLFAIALNLNGSQTFKLNNYSCLCGFFTVSSIIIILYRCLCFRFSWSILQYVCAVTVSAPAPPELCESFQLFVSKAKLNMQIWSTCVFKTAHLLAVFFFFLFSVFECNFYATSGF